MNIANDGSKYGVSQYRFAHNYDLRDKSFTIIYDARKYTLSFKGRDTISFDDGKGGEIDACECLKIEAETYFIRFGSNYAVFDLEAGAATLALAGEHVVGSIEAPGVPAAAAGALHGYSDEMTGTGVRWMLGCFRFTDHIYFCADKARASWSPKEKDFKDYDAKYIKIKEGIFLVDVTGVVPGGACAPEGCDHVIMLQDYEHMMFVGCVTSKSGPVMISGYGEFPDFD